MTPVLGLSVGGRRVQAVVVARKQIVWAGESEYGDLDELHDLVARLVADSPVRLRRARAVLQGSAVQLRSVTPAPPLTAAKARRYVELESRQLFRRNGAPLATDAIVLTTGPGQRTLWAGAVVKPLAIALLAACEAAGLRLESLGPGAEVVPAVVERIAEDGQVAIQQTDVVEVAFVRGRHTWKRRLVRRNDRPQPQWVQPLAKLGVRAAEFAAAYGAAVRRPMLSLVPAATTAVRNRHAWRRLQLTAAVAAALWVFAGLVHVARLALTTRVARQQATALAPRSDSVVALRQRVHETREALGTLAAAESAAGRPLELLAAVSGALGDSAFVVSLQVSEARAVRLVGYARSATRALADVERVRELRDVKYEGPVLRESITHGDGSVAWERFSIVAEWRRSR